MFIARAGLLAAAASRAHETKHRVILRERRNIVRMFFRNSLAGHRHTHKTPAAAPDAREITTLETSPKRRARNTKGPKCLIYR